MLRNVKGNGVAMLGGIYCFEVYIANTCTVFVEQYTYILEQAVYNNYPFDVASLTI